MAKRTLVQNEKGAASSRLTRQARRLQNALAVLEAYNENPEALLRKRRPLSDGSGRLKVPAGVPGSANGHGDLIDKRASLQDLSSAPTLLDDSATSFTDAIRSPCLSRQDPQQSSVKATGTTQQPTLTLTEDEAQCPEGLLQIRQAQVAAPSNTAKQNPVGSPPMPPATPPSVSQQHDTFIPSRAAAYPVNREHKFHSPPMLRSEGYSPLEKHRDWSQGPGYVSYDNGATSWYANSKPSLFRGFTESSERDNHSIQISPKTIEQISAITQAIASTAAPSDSAQIAVALSGAYSPHIPGLSREESGPDEVKSVREIEVNPAVRSNFSDWDSDETDDEGDGTQSTVVEQQTKPLGEEEDVTVSISEIEAILDDSRPPALLQDSMEVAALPQTRPVLRLDTSGL